MDYAILGSVALAMVVMVGWSQWCLNSTTKTLTETFSRALTQANQVAYDGMQELVRKQTEILRATMEGVQTAAKEMVKGFQTVALAGQPKELVEQAVQKAFANMRELAEVATKTQTEALTIISNRAMQNVEEMKTLMQLR